ncbi:MAG: ArsR/SmtB family transcription factor, partial [Halothiobacillaceae bacterium]
HAEALFKAAGDRTRLRILKILEPGPLCVCQIVAVLGLGQSTVSKHLSILSGADLIDSERRGRWTFYRLAKPRSPEVRSLLSAVRACAAEDPQVAADLAKVRDEKIQSLVGCSPGRAGRSRRGGRGHERIG